MSTKYVKLEVHYNYNYFYAAAKSEKRLNEEEAGVIDLGRLESSMQAAIAGLTSEFTNTVIARITPGIVGIYAYTVCVIATYT